VACGGRDHAFTDFNIAINQHQGPGFVGLWTDSEDPLTDIEDTWGHAAETIGGLGPAGQPAVADLARLLEDRAVGAFGYPVAEKAAWSLGQIGAGARSAGADLERCLDDPHHALGCAAALALGRIGARSGLDWLIAQPRSGERNRRERAAIALGEARELARDAVNPQGRVPGRWRGIRPRGPDRPGTARLSCSAPGSMGEG
jgi:HEAT repeat protein